MNCTGNIDINHFAIFLLVRLIARRAREKRLKLKLNSREVFLFLSLRNVLRNEITAGGMFNYINQSRGNVGSPFSQSPFKINITLGNEASKIPAKHFTRSERRNIAFHKEFFFLRALLMEMQRNFPQPFTLLANQKTGFCSYIRLRRK